MRLFEVDENNEVKLNLPWIQMIPEFKALFNAQGKKIAYDRNIQARKLLSYIYFVRDFTSPLRDWEEEPRHLEALKYTGLTEEDVKATKVQEAINYYKILQYEACRPLKTYEASMKGLAAMDTYLQTVNFTEKDKQGKLLYTPNQYVANLALTNKAYDELAKLASRVQIELEQSTGIRGKGIMGDREVKMSQSNDTIPDISWDENVISPDGRTQWTEITGLLKKKTTKTEEEE